MKLPKITSNLYRRKTAIPSVSVLCSSQKWNYEWIIMSGLFIFVVWTGEFIIFWSARRQGRPGTQWGEVAWRTGEKGEWACMKERRRNNRTEHGRGNGQEKSGKKKSTGREYRCTTSVNPLHKVGSRLSGRVVTWLTIFFISAWRADHESAIKFCRFFDAAELILHLWFRKKKKL